MPWAELRTRGFALLDAEPSLPSAELAAREPWEAASRLLGQAPELVERQPIAPVPWGKSFASSMGHTPLHTDSQLFAGAPADLQLMFCERAAADGGESTLLDTWALLDAVERDDPELFSLLFRAPRRIPFVFGEVVGPTVSLRRGAVVFTQSPMPQPNDPIARRLAPHIERAPALRVRPTSGQLLLVDNHRMLHGRTAFGDGARSFTRLLIWLKAPLPSPERLHALCAEASARWAPFLAELPERARRRLGLSQPVEPGAERRRIVLDMLRGVPPGVLAQRHGVDEAELYAWRDRLLAQADAALAEDDGETADALARFVGRWGVKA